MSFPMFATTCTVHYVKSERSEVFKKNIAKGRRPIFRV